MSVDETSLLVLVVTSMICCTVGTKTFTTTVIDSSTTFNRGQLIFKSSHQRRRVFRSLEVAVAKISRLAPPDMHLHQSTIYYERNIRFLWVISNFALFGEVMYIGLLRALFLSCLLIIILQLHREKR